jgi:hypothetical protein
VVRQRNAGFAAPQGVAEGGADVPGHDPLEGQPTASDLLVVAHGGCQQLHAWPHPGTGKGAQVVFRLGHADGREVDHHPEFVTVPHLIVTVQIAVH